MKRYAVEIAEEIYFDKFHQNLIARNPTGKSILSTDLYRYSRKTGVWRHLSLTEIRRHIIVNYGIEDMREVDNIVKHLVLISAEKFLQSSGGKFNTDPHKILFKNGLFRLDKGLMTGSVRKRLYATHRFPFDYDEYAECPAFLAFLDQIFDKNKNIISYVQEMIGYFLFPTTKYEAVFIWVGGGSNGKTTLANIIKKLVTRDGYSEIHTKDLGKASIMYDMVEKLVNFSEENEIGSRNRAPVLNTAELKRISSGVEMSAKRVYQDPITFIPYARQVIIANKLPKIDDNSRGWKRRLHVLPFPKTIPERERIPNLDEKIAEHELPGISKWAIEGYRRLEERGKFDLPNEIGTAVLSYAIASSSPVQFLFEKVGVNNLLKLHYRVTDIYKSYKGWAIYNRHDLVDRVKFMSEIVEFFLANENFGIEPYITRGQHNAEYLRFKKINAHSVDEGAKAILKFLPKKGKVKKRK